jgi:hypothetical protein
MTESERTQLDAIEMLMQDHRELESLFREFEFLHATKKDTARVVDTACAELKIHDTLKSELFCPAVSDAVDEPAMQRLLAQVDEGHQVMRELIARVEQADADRTLRDATFNLLSENVERQFDLTENHVFPRARELPELDLVLVAQRMQARRNNIVHGI